MRLQHGERRRDLFVHNLGGSSYFFKSRHPGWPQKHALLGLGQFNQRADFPHRDKRRLTILLALTDAKSGDFAGGGTAFWADEAEGDAPSGPAEGPTLTVHARTGCALVFCGELTHGALPVTDGRRAVFVASFGPRGEDYRHVSRRPRSVRLVGALRRALARAWS